MNIEITHKDICPYYEDNCKNIGCICPKYLAFEKANNPDEIQKQLDKMNIDYSLDLFYIMFSVQKHFSSRFFDIDKLNDFEIQKWIQQYDTCIHDEISEVHEHLHFFNYIYGDKKINIKELQKEFIDIWHFAIDMFIVSGAKPNQIIDSYCELYNLDKQSEKQKTLKYFFENEKNQILKNKYIKLEDKSINEFGILILTGYIMSALRKIKQNINWKHWKKNKTILNNEKLHVSFSYLLSSLIKCFIFVGLNEKTLYEIYISKNMENIFRQEFGY